MLKEFGGGQFSSFKNAPGSCGARGVPLVVDNTFASPMLQNPLALGADVVLHSTTKYINGHSDVVGGALVTSDLDLVDRLRFLQNSLGAVPSPFDCYLVLRGLKTLPVRIERHVQSATELARRLEQHPRVERVIYPGLESHPQHALAARQMRGGGGIVSVVLAGGAQRRDALSEGAHARSRWPRAWAASSRSRSTPR